jgi:hypothetical protein
MESIVLRAEGGKIMPAPKGFSIGVLMVLAAVLPGLAQMKTIEDQYSILKLRIPEAWTTEIKGISNKTLYALSPDGKIRLVVSTDKRFHETFQEYVEAYVDSLVKLDGWSQERLEKHEEGGRDLIFVRGTKMGQGRKIVDDYYFFFTETHQGFIQFTCLDGDLSASEVVYELVIMSLEWNF